MWAQLPGTAYCMRTFESQSIVSHLHQNVVCSERFPTSLICQEIIWDQTFWSQMLLEVTLETVSVVRVDSSLWVSHKTRLSFRSESYIAYCTVSCVLPYSPISDLLLRLSLIHILPTDPDTEETEVEWMVETFGPPCRTLWMNRFSLRRYMSISFLIWENSSKFSSFVHLHCMH